MRQALITVAALAAVLGSLMLFQNCGSKSTIALSSNASTASVASSSSAINGNYRVTQWTCGNVNILSQMSLVGITGASFVVSGNSATQTLTYSGGCLINQALAVSYPDAAHLSATEGATSCAGACGATQCMASDAPAGVAPYLFALATSGTTLTLTRDIAASDLGSNSLYNLAGCAQGDPLTIVLEP